MNLELYTTGLSPFCRTVELQLAMKGIAYSPNLPSREFVRGGGFKDLNPLGKVPVLVIDGVAVPESQVLCELIEELYPDPPLLPADPMDRCRVRLLVRIADLYIVGPSAQLLNNEPGERGAGLAASCINSIERGVAALEHWLVPGPYATGEARSIADCALPTSLFAMTRMTSAFKLEGIPPLGEKAAAYLEGIRNDPDVARCLAGLEESVQQRLAQTA